MTLQKLILLSLLLFGSVATPLFAAPAGGWKAGENYIVLIPPQTTQVAPGKIEVIEFFHYGCPHCYRLEPFIVEWQTTKPEYIEFVRIPGVWSQDDRPYAKLFYALQAMGRSDLHQAVFDAIHRDKQSLLNDGTGAAEGSFKLQAKFAEAHGLNVTEFGRIYHSSLVDKKVERAAQLIRQCKVTGVPSVVVNGKFLSDMDKVGGAGTQRILLSLVNDLAANERSQTSSGTVATAVRPPDAR